MADYFSVGSFYENSSWHGKEIDSGGVFTERDTIQNHMIRSHMDYEVEVVPSCYLYNGEVIEVPNKFQVVIPKTKWKEHPEAIRQISNRYTVLQNSRIAEIFEPLNSGNFPLESLGVLKNGRIVFLELRLEDFNVAGHPKEGHRSYLAFANNHVQESTFMGLTTVRLQCMNTFLRAMKDMTSIPHSADLDLEIEFRATVIHNTLETRKHHKEMLDAMFVKKITADGLAQLVESAFPTPSKPRSHRVYNSVDSLGLDQNNDVIATMAERVESDMTTWERSVERQKEFRMDVAQAFTKFNDEQGYTANSIYSAWNSVSETVNHSPRFYGDISKNMVSLFFGQKNQMLQNSWRVCEELVKV